MREKMGFGIWGCGMVAKIHAEAIRNMEAACLVGVADCRLSNSEKLAAEYGCGLYEDYEALLQDPAIDVVCICTPSGCHAGDALLALSHKKHVILEKPMALRIEDADAVVEAAEKSGCLLTVMSQLRFSEDVQRVKNLVEQDAFGKLVFCNLSMKYWRDPEYYASSSWRGTKAHDGGGALMNQGIHGVDLLTYLVGDAVVRKGVVKTRMHAIEVEDTAAALLEFKNGALGMIEASTCAYPGFERRLEIHGDCGYVILKENTLTELMVNGQMWKKEAETLKSGASDPANIGWYPHMLQMENMIRAIRGQEALVVNAADGRRVLKLILDVYQSALSAL